MRRNDSQLSEKINKKQKHTNKTGFVELVEIQRSNSELPGKKGKQRRTKRHTLGALKLLNGTQVR